MAEPKPSRKEIVLLVLAGLVGLALVAIGVRFLISPSPAAKFFGIGGSGAGPHAFHHVIAIRDMWLGALAMAFAVLRDWRALALWLGLGAIVCLVDASIAAQAGAHLRSIGFHLASGLLCAWLAAASLQRHLRQTR